jgi:SAM-dependent methyltransferase
MRAHGSLLSWEDAVSWLRSQPDKAQLVRECYYDDPPLAAAQRYYASEEWAAVRALLGTGRGQALDIGAGRGIASYALARDGFAVTALEPDSSELVGAGAIRALARESALPITVLEQVVEQLPCADGSFDVVFARAALHHARDLAAACREFFRVLRPGGVLLAIREHVISSRADLQRFFDEHPLHHLYGGENALLLREYLAAIRAAGFGDLSVLSPWESPINYAPRTLAGLKEELALRASAPLPVLRGAVRAALAPAPCWLLARAVLGRIDRRPGRLYSFRARR